MTDQKSSLLAVVGIPSAVELVDANKCNQPQLAGKLGTVLGVSSAGALVKFPTRRRANTFPLDALRVV